MKPIKRILGILVCMAQFAGGLIAEEIHLGPKDNWFETLNGSGLKPGDIVVLKGGIYSDARKLTLSYVGEEKNRITIRTDAGDPAFFKRPDNRQNSFNLEGAQHLTLENLEITGGSTGIRISGRGDRITRGIWLMGLHIHHTGGAAVTCNNPDNVYERMWFKGNHIHHTSGHGEGFYLGGNNDKAGRTTTVFKDSIIEQNDIHDLIGNNVSQGDGIEIKDGSYNNIIRDNVIHNTKYPGITVYGTDENPPNVIERNQISLSGNNGIQAASDAIIRNNIIFQARADGIRSMNHQSASVGNLRIINNTIVQSKGAGIRVDPPKGAPSGEVIVANNAVFTSNSFRIPKAGHVRIIANQTGDAAKELRMFFPLTGSKLLGAADSTLLPEDDFSGKPRAGRKDVGAYSFDPNGTSRAFRRPRK